ncbi:hypothetical protein EVAR_20824_1 [Eumeta japonica]|uniref:Uncharacterized protein n=1 Tax=Eumeta variegata TaxID=151549 RepID=A0A4C1UEE0_EUMVA|nr:hypothetical protein EVAR_20824_1 [Eumeta japonica]
MNKRPGRARAIKMKYAHECARLRGSVGIGLFAARRRPLSARIDAEATRTYEKESCNSIGNLPIIYAQIRISVEKTGSLRQEKKNSIYVDTPVPRLARARSRYKQTPQTDTATA